MVGRIGVGSVGVWVRLWGVEEMLCGWVIGGGLGWLGGVGVAGCWGECWGGGVV